MNQDNSSIGAQTRRPSKRRLVQIASWASIILVALAVVAFILVTPTNDIPFVERDWILITDFENQTGEEVFEGTLREALSIDLQQSSHVNVIPDERLEDALSRSGNPEAEVIDADLGREIAMSEGVAAVVEGSIDKEGDAYLLSARLVNPATGDVVNTKRVKAQKREKVLTALDKLSRDIRRNLGESAVSIQRRDQPLPQVSTGSLIALQYYTLGRQATRKARWEEAIPLFMKAIAADSSFANAYYSLASLMNNLDRTADALQYSALAREHKNSVTERERYLVEAEYYRIREEFGNAIEQYKKLIANYPDDFNAHNNLCFTYQYTRQYQEAVAESREMIRLYPHSWYAHHNAALANAGHGDLARAEAEFLKALEVNPEAFWSRVGLSWIYAIQGRYEDSLAELSQATPPGREWISLKHGSYHLLYLYRGEDEKAREHLHEAMAVDEEIGNLPGAARKCTALAINYNLHGDRDQARAYLQRAVELNEEAMTLALLGAEFARRGDLAAAERTASHLADLVDREDRNLNRSYHHLLRSQIAYHGGDHDTAVDEMKTSLGLAELLLTHWTFGEMLLEMGLEAESEVHFTYIADHRWAAFFDGYPGLWPRSLYKLGVIHENRGDLSQAFQYYQELTDLWDEGGAQRVEYRAAQDRLAILKQ